MATKHIHLENGDDVIIYHHHKEIGRILLANYCDSISGERDSLELYVKTTSDDVGFSHTNDAFDKRFAEVVQPLDLGYR